MPGRQPPRTSAATEVDAYIATASPAAQAILQRIRREVQAAVPQATEAFSYRMPAFAQPKVFFYYAAFKQHIGVYPPLSANHPLRQQLQPYANDKGNLRFPLDQPVPFELIAQLAKALVRQYAPK